MVGRPSRRSRSGLRPSWSSKIAWEAPPEVCKLSGDPPGGPELVGRPSRRSGTARETLPEFRNCSGDPAGGPKVVGDPPAGPELVGRHSWRSGSGLRPSWSSGTTRENLLEDRHCSGDPP